MPELQITCGCGAIAQKLDSNLEHPSVVLCHCDTCRHTTGLLCASYLPISARPDLSAVSSYASSSFTKVYFCRRCGCHAFRSSDDYRWEVAAGVVVSGAASSSRKIVGGHLHVGSTLDGGMSSWIKSLSGTNVVMQQDCGVTARCHHDPNPPSPVFPGVLLEASCHCQRVSFMITRPDHSSHLPKSNFPDLMVPYHTSDPVITNPGDVKWWLCEGETKYLAGTCACQSCRLSSGFEIQTWAFIPRNNIQFLTAGEILAVDFEELQRRGVLQGYESSPGVMREFCPGCGAVVFWHDRFRPELLDVSVGLLRAADGALALEWLSWWRDRVSFSEDARAGRQGLAADRAAALVSALERGLH